MNKYQPHVYVIPEDEADRQLANGFVNHPRVKTRKLQIVPPAGGWSNVLEIFRMEYISYLRKYKSGHVILLVDFDGHYNERRPRFAEAIPSDLRERVFVVGAEHNPETLKEELNEPFEDIGESLAEDCCNGTVNVWGQGQMAHNEPDRQRLFQVIRPILFDFQR